jgi:magnesium transporter
MTRPAPPVAGCARWPLPRKKTVRASLLIVKTSTGNRLLPLTAVSAINGGIRACYSFRGMDRIADGSEGLLLLSRDLLDQQVIDVHGRKVVRVNDVDFHHDSAQNRSVLRVGGVDVGPRGAVRRLLKGMIPAAASKPLLLRMSSPRYSLGLRRYHRDRSCSGASG